jgi:hypothetical protein
VGACPTPLCAAAWRSSSTASDASQPFKKGMVPNVPVVPIVQAVLNLEL